MTKKKPPTKKKTSKTKTAKLDKVSEEEFLRVLDNISKRLANKFKFAYHSFEDMKQQAAIFALEGLEQYDNSRPLENFLWTHVRNRLFNYKRNNYQRPDKPCLTCEFFDKLCKKSLNQCLQHEDKYNCAPYTSWAKRNENKKNIIQPTYIEDNSFLASQYKLSETVQNKEIIKFLDDHIEMEYRESYLRLKHGTKIPKSQLVKLQAYIAKLLEETQWRDSWKKALENEDN
jgi:DNA-directed RNA polymerase specialized sigma24 family protein